MALSYVANGTDADPAQYNGIVDEIQNIDATVMSQGGTVNGATLARNVGWRQSSGTTSANGRITVTHGLGFTPRIIPVMAGGGGPYGVYVVSPTSTQFTLQFYGLASGAAAASGQAVTVNWLGLPVSEEMP